MEPTAQTRIAEITAELERLNTQIKEWTVVAQKALRERDTARASTAVRQVSRTNFKISALTEELRNLVPPAH
jgi:phage shock protein A